MTITGLVRSTSRLKVDSDITSTLFLRLAYAMQRFLKMLMIVFIVVCCYWFLLLIYTAKMGECYIKIIIIFSNLLSVGQKLRCSLFPSGLRSSRGGYLLL